MSRILPPFDDTVQLDDMPVDISDTSPIVRNNDIAESHVRTPDVEVVAGDISKHRAYFMVFVLLFINLLNYMDRFTIAGVLVDIQNYYHIGNSEAGLIQTVFIVSYMSFHLYLVT